VNLREILNWELFDLAGTPVTVGSVATAFIVFLVAILVSLVSRKVVGRALARRGLMRPGAMATLDRLIHYAFLVVGAAVALTTVGLDLSALFATGAVAAVALAFALQNILQNFVSGIILLAERSITPLDILVVDGQMVRVERMGIRSTIVRNLDEEEIIMPNSNLVQSSVKNLTLADPICRARTQVGVAYATDLDGAARVLAEAAAGVEGRNPEREPRVQLQGFGDSSIVFDVSVWVDDPWELPAARTRLNFAIWRALKAAKITIAFPQMDVHIVSNEAGLGAPTGG